MENSRSIPGFDFRRALSRVAAGLASLCITSPEPNAGPTESGNLGYTRRKSKNIPWLPLALHSLPWSVDDAFALTELRLWPGKHVGNFLRPDIAQSLCILPTPHISPFCRVPGCQRGEENKHVIYRSDGHVHIQPASSAEGALPTPTGETRQTQGELSIAISCHP